VRTAPINSTHLQAQTLAGRLPALLLAAEQIAACVAAGVHGRRRPGPGEHFWQYRRYQPGEPANRIDWRASSRGQHLLVREREWEAAQTALLWLDSSESLNWASRKDLPTKRERAELLLLALADLLLRGGERVGLLANPQPPMSGRNILGRLAVLLDKQSDNVSALPPAIPYPRHARVILLSDGLDDIGVTAERLKQISAQGLTGHFVQVLDPAEVEFNWQGRVLFEGLEGEGRWLAPRADKLQQAYMAKLHEHQTALRTLLSRMGWTHTLHQTDKRPELTLLALHNLLSEPC
jgi:uncharacterized protein (DUF58 family)